MKKNFSEAAERNKNPILAVLKEVIAEGDRRLLEIGAGTGQHAIHMAPQFPHLAWFPTDVGESLQELKRAVTEARISNIELPSRVVIGKDDFPKLKFDIVFTANTFHIMHWKECKTLMKLLGHRLREGSRVVIYGPFKYNGAYTSESNELFDESLKERDPLMGIRSFEDVNNAMVKNGFELIDDVDMPANNRTLVYRRLKFAGK